MMATFRTLEEAHRWTTLWTLADRDPRTIDQILLVNPDRSVVTRPTRWRIVRALESEGLVEVDRRRRPYRIRLAPHPDLPETDRSRVTLTDMDMLDR